MTGSKEVNDQQENIAESLQQFAACSFLICTTKRETRELKTKPLINLSSEHSITTLVLVLSFETHQTQSNYHSNAKIKQLHDIIIRGESNGAG